MKTALSKFCFVFALAGFVASAQAQTYRVPQTYAPYGQPPAYLHAAAPQQPYAVEVSPGVYVIQRPTPLRAYPYMRGESTGNEPVTSDRPRQPADRGLIQELRKHYAPKQAVINTTKVVRDPPVVRETTRIVDDPPRVVERRHIVDEAPIAPRPKRRAQSAVAEAESDMPAKPDGKARVIRAEAEITILGPDRMSIRLFRKRRGGDGEPEAKAQPDE